MKKLISIVVFFSVLGYVSIASFWLIERGLTVGTNNAELVDLAVDQVNTWRAGNQPVLAGEK